MDEKNLEMNHVGVVELSGERASGNEGEGNAHRDDQEMAYYGKRQQLRVIILLIQYSHEISVFYCRT